MAIRAACSRIHYTVCMAGSGDGSKPVSVSDAICSLELLHIDVFDSQQAEPTMREPEITDS